MLLVATVFVRNLYCRFLCPVGATLGLMSFLTVFKIKRWSECSTCRICEKACEWGAIDGPKILVTECVRCDDCERLYADEPSARTGGFSTTGRVRAEPFPLRPSGARVPGPGSREEPSTELTPSRTTRCNVTASPALVPSPGSRAPSP